MLYIGLTAHAPTTITAATHCCTSNFFALIVCSQIPSINGQITNRYIQLTANSWRGRCLKAKIWRNLFLKAFEVILCQKVVVQNSGKLQYTGIFAADGAMPLYWSSTVLISSYLHRGSVSCPPYRPDWRRCSRASPPSIGWSGRPGSLCRVRENQIPS